MKGWRLLGNLSGVVSHWFREPEKNAAGRMGLFRILYCLFYFWFLSQHTAAWLSGLPAEHWGPKVVVDWLPRKLPPPFFQSLEAILVGALFLLMVGYQVRLMTAVVLVAGCLLEAFYVALIGDHASVFLTFYIPFFMLLGGRWGDVYSLDAMLRGRKGYSAIEPTDSSWCYFLSARCTLVILLVLFTSSGLLKVFAGGTWLERPDLLANIMLEKNVRAAIFGLPLNPFAPFVAEHPLAYNYLRYQTILFESAFVLGLLSRTLCRILLCAAVVFHSINALWLVVTFTPVLVVYLLFVDWQTHFERLPIRSFVGLRRIPSAIVVGAALLLAVALAISWNLNATPRNVANFGGALNWRTIWYPVLPVAVFALCSEVVGVTRAFCSHVRNHQNVSQYCCKGKVNA